MSIEVAGAIGIVSAVFGAVGFFFSNVSISNEMRADIALFIKHVSIALFLGGMVLLLWLGSL